MFSANLTTFTSTESQQVSLREMLGGFEFICSFNGKTFAQQRDPLWLRLHGARVSATEAPPHRRAAVEHLRSAESKFMAGLYTDCVSECRKGIETLKHSRGKFEWAKLQNADSRRAMDKDDRLGALAAVMHHFAHP